MTAKKRKFKRQFDPGYLQAKGEKIDSNSMTIPDMSIGIKQLLLNHTRGLGLGTYHEGIYSDMEIPIFDDITDKDTYIAELHQQKLDLQKQIDKEQKEAYDKALEKKIAAQNAAEPKTEPTKE